MFAGLKERARQFIRNAVSSDLKELRQQIRNEISPSAIAQAVASTPAVWPDDWSRVSLGENTHVVNATFNVSSGSISVGDHTFFGHNVSLITGTHYIEKTGAERQAFPTEGRDILIGQGVWVASNAVILGPCTIGDDAVIAAGAVVLSGTTVEPGAIYAGVPAKRIR